MADSPTSSSSSAAAAAATETSTDRTESDNHVSQSNQTDPSPPSSSLAQTTSIPVNPNPAVLLPPPPPLLPHSQPPPIQPYALPQQLPAVPPMAPPSFRPLAPPVPIIPAAPQFSPLPNLNLQNSNYQNPNVQPPGVPGATSGAGTAGVSVPQMMLPYPSPGQPSNLALRQFLHLPNGYPSMAQGMLPPPGMARYPSPYPVVLRPPFPPRPMGAIGVMPQLSRPLIPGIRGPGILPVVRPAVVPVVTPAEKSNTTVYVGKIASTVENDFVLSLLQLCGPVKNWKRAQNPTNGTPAGFGFCEFDSAESVLRALRLLSKLNVDGQELVLNVNQATRDFLNPYVQKKIENSNKVKATETEGAEKEGEIHPSEEKTETPKPSVEDRNKDENDSENKGIPDIANFGMVTDEDREADREALEKLTSMLDERLKTRPPLPPPPPLPSTDASGNSNSELPATSRDRDSEVDIMRNDDRNDDEMTSENKPTSEHDKTETSSPDRSRRNDRRSRDRDRDRDRDLKREKERELERFEREREQERALRERDREIKVRDDERRYKSLVKDWESRERDKERLRKLEKEREKEKEYKRRREIMDQEHDSDDGDSKKRKHKSSGSEERRRKMREKEEDLADRLKEEEEIAEAKRRADEEQLEQVKQKQNAVRLMSAHSNNESDEATLGAEPNVRSSDEADEQMVDGDYGHQNHIGDDLPQNGTGDDSVIGSVTMSDARQSCTAPAKKLGFGLVGSGKRTAVPSVFHEEEDEDAQKDKKMRPLVPIEYTTEELQAVQPVASGDPSSNLVAAAEFAKRISNIASKEERTEGEKERSRRSHDNKKEASRSVDESKKERSHRDRERNNGETNRSVDESKKEAFDRDREHGVDKVKTLDNQKLLDAKQLIDMIPKTKEELFSYEINWAVYDKNDLHERMRPWISKKIMEFLGEEETSLVDFIVSTTVEHVKASEMLARMQLILDDEAEMFVLKMWRMLIFEIKKIETGLASRSKT